MIARFCDECGAQTHSCVEIAEKDATVYMRFEGVRQLGRLRVRKKKGDIKRNVWEIDLCLDHWPQGEPPQIPNEPKNVEIYWNPELL